MSDFEYEYRKYSKESAPDLWTRIESGIDAYEESKKLNPTADPVQEDYFYDSEDVASDGSDDSNITYINEGNVEEYNNESYGDSYNEDYNNVYEDNDHAGKKSFNKIYIGLIAAAACCLIAIPAAIRLSGSSSSETSAFPGLRSIIISDSGKSDKEEAAAITEEAAATADVAEVPDGAVETEDAAPASKSSNQASKSDQTSEAPQAVAAPTANPTVEFSTSTILGQTGSNSSEQTSSGNQVADTGGTNNGSSGSSDKPAAEADAEASTEASKEAEASEEATTEAEAKEYGEQMAARGFAELIKSLKEKK